MREVGRRRERPTKFLVGDAAEAGRHCPIDNASMIQLSRRATMLSSEWTLRYTGATVPSINSILSSAYKTCLVATVDSCTCGKGKANVVDHSLGCRYRLLREVLTSILSAKIFDGVFNAL